MDTPRAVRAKVDGRDIHHVATFVRKAMKDDETRAAVKRAIDRGKRVYDSISDDGPGGGMSRLARDPRMQNEVGAFVRAATHAIDAGVKANRRRRRRVMAAIATALGLGALVAWKQRAGESRAGSDSSGYAAGNASGDRPQTPAGHEIGVR